MNRMQHTAALLAPRRFQPRSGPGEQLAYINKPEADLLRQMGGSGRMTPHGIPSFSWEDSHPDANYGSNVGNVNGGVGHNDVNSAGQGRAGGGSQSSIDAAMQQTKVGDRIQASGVPMPRDYILRRDMMPPTAPPMVDPAVAPPEITPTWPGGPVPPQGPFGQRPHTEPGTWRQFGPRSSWGNLNAGHLGNWMGSRTRNISVPQSNSAAPTMGGENGYGVGSGPRINGRGMTGGFAHPYDSSTGDATHGWNAADLGRW